MNSSRKTWFLLLAGLIILVVILYKLFGKSEKKQQPPAKNEATSFSKEWQAPDINAVPASEEGNLIRYGKELIANTARYLGPKGTVTKVSNGMNCQNCHIDAGLRPYANCFSAVASIYPVFRPRSGMVESIEFRVNDCLQRSLNGKPIDSLSKEMRAVVAYLKWIGKDVVKGVKPRGAGTEELRFMDRAADPSKGKVLYAAKCQSCHGNNGQGSLQPDSSAFIFPPLWGQHSYNTGAGLYRLTRFAGYIKYSMPFGASHQNPQLTDEEAWDVAAFVNSQPRPQKSFPQDWPVLSSKAIDYPYGPYTDSFPEEQHKYGPFGPIKKARDEAKRLKKPAGA